MSKENGILTLNSQYSFQETTSRVKALLKENGFHIFGIIDHAKSAERHDRKLNPTLLFIFGNPKTGGTGLMQENQVIAIDLPAKLLVWEDHQKQTHITTNDFEWLNKRHRLSGKNRDIIQKLKTGIADIARIASGN